MASIVNKLEYVEVVISDGLRSGMGSLSESFDTSRTVLFFQGQTNSADVDSAPSDTSISCVGRVKLENDTVIRATREGGSSGGGGSSPPGFGPPSIDRPGEGVDVFAGEVRIYLTAVEFSSEIVESVEYGEVFVSDATQVGNYYEQTHTLSNPVDPTRSVAVWLGHSTEGAISAAMTAYLPNYHSLIELVSGTTVAARALEKTGTSAVNFCVVQFTEAAIESIQYKSYFQTSQTTTVSINSIDANNSMVFYNGYRRTSTDSDWSNSEPTFYLTDTNLHSIVGDPNGVVVAATIVEFVPGIITPQRGSSLGSGMVIANSAYTEKAISPLDLDRSFVSYTGFSAFHTNEDADELPGMFLGQGRSGYSLRISKNGGDGNTYIWWEVVEFAETFPTGGGEEYTLTAELESFNCAGFAASLVRGRTLLATPDSFAVNGKAATLSRGYVAKALARTYSLEGQEAAVLKGTNLLAESVTFSSKSGVARLLYGRVVPAEPGSFALTGRFANVYVSKVLQAVSGVFNSEGQSAKLLAQRKAQAELGGFDIEGQPVIVLREATLPAEVDSFSQQGISVKLVRGRVLPAEVGDIVVSGFVAALGVERKLDAAAGAYTLIGQPAITSYGKVVMAEVGSFALSGKEADKYREYILKANTVSLLTKGQSALLLAGTVMPATVGTFSLTEKNANTIRGYRLAAQGAALSLEGKPIVIKREYQLAATGGSLQLSGPPVKFINSYALVVAAASFQTKAQNALLTYARRFRINNGVFSTTEIAANLLRGRIIRASSVVVSLSGIEVFFSMEYRIKADVTIFNMSGNSTGSGRIYKDKEAVTAGKYEDKDPVVGSDFYKNAKSADTVTYFDKN